MPTGTHVKCQFTRDLQTNRERARKLLRGKLEELLMPKQSKRELGRLKERKKKAKSKRRREIKAKLKSEEEMQQQQQQQQPQQSASSSSS